MFLAFLWMIQKGLSFVSLLPTGILNFISSCNVHGRLTWDELGDYTQFDTIRGCRGEGRLLCPRNILNEVSKILCCGVFIGESVLIFGKHFVSRLTVGCS